MKKINSIGYGGKIVGVALLLTAAIPLILHTIRLFYPHELLVVCAKISFGIGVGIFLFLTLFLRIELYQDQRLFSKYEAQKNSKLPLNNGFWECQNCGNQTVQFQHRSCAICGILFEGNGRKMIKLHELSALSKTLFIPLAVRAKETVKDHPLLIDKMAVTVLEQCDMGEMVIDGGEISTHGILARTVVMDAEIKALIAENPNAVVVNLGAGLDTRFFRLDNGSIRWYDLDLPEVITLRARFLGETERLHFLAKSILDPTWTKEVALSKNDTVVLIAEGLLMYFSEKDVKEILSILTAAFPHAELFLDVVHSFFVGKKISSDFLWGIEKAENIKAFAQGATLVKAWSAGSLLKKRQSGLFRLLNIFPSTKNRSQILHIRLHE